MATPRRNILANLVGGGWVAALTLVITPLQINLLGLEAYGLVGFIATLQIVFGICDFGLSSTVTRELASDRSPGATGSRALVRTATSVYWALTLLVGVTLIWAAKPLAGAWFKSGGLERTVLEQGLEAVAVFLCLRWPVALYTGILGGLQRMDLLNLVKASSISLRLLGGIGVLLVWRDVAVFLLWTSISAVVEVLLYFSACRRAFPGMDLRPGFSWAALRSVWVFSLSMNAIAILTALITQIDRLMVSKMLPLESLGLYSLSYTTASAVLLVLSSVSAAMLPAFAEAAGLLERDTLLRRYDQANRVILLAAGVVAFPLLFFGEPILAAWIGHDSASRAWQPLALLAGGFWFGAAVSNAYSVAVAHRRTDLLLLVSGTSLLPYAAVLYFAIGSAGPAGAAGANMSLNLVYLLVLLPLVHKHVLGLGAVHWFLRTMLPVLALGTMTFGLARGIAGWLGLRGDMVMLAALLAAAVGYGTLGFRLLGDDLRLNLRQLITRAGFVGAP